MYFSFFRFVHEYPKILVETKKKNFVVDTHTYKNQKSDNIDFIYLQSQPSRDILIHIQFGVR